MSLLTTPQAYTGPTLRSVADLATWRQAFLRHARLLHIAEYYATPAFVSPYLTDHISPVQLHSIVTAAGANEASTRSAIAAACAGIQQRLRQFALDFLAAATRVWV
ncbi:hypothetical protein ACHHYP_08940 [Achlya hypogyna]|uniref:Uncharacterized protein n=1 Tax=Achlya hypogyna TaxID=1202772 RepID=A0A1V9ZJW1_ACHHY|nr:hypothetical protein ACHHYP_08940 [Achlya hypogyna]